MEIKKIFLASSQELAEDRNAFEIMLGRLNGDWVVKNYFFQLVIWEDFLDTLSKTGLQSEYNKAIRECDIFVMLFFTKVGKYTAEEFETAFGSFQETNKPVIYTYFKDSPILSGQIGDEIISLLEFKKKLKTLGHFVSIYRNVEDLKWQFGRQLEKLFTPRADYSLELTQNSSQTEIDTVALALTNRLLSDDDKKLLADKRRYSDVIARTSDITKYTILVLASNIRKQNWMNNKDMMERTIPAFEALIDSDKRKDNHSYYGQLAYALKDKKDPDWENSKKNFDRAIDILGNPEEQSSYLYDFNRAICLIQLDAEFNNSKPSTKKAKQTILKDLNVFYKQHRDWFDYLVNQAANKVILKWMQLNGVNKLPA